MILLKFGKDTLEELIPRMNESSDDFTPPYPTSISIRMTDPGPSGKGKGRIAYLGPEGTYGQQVRLSSCSLSSITDLEMRN